MVTNIVLIRHAERESSFSGDDHLCPISAKGKKEALQLAHNLLKAGLFPTVILTSTSTRTKETAEAINVLFQVPIDEEPALTLSGNYDDLVSHIPSRSFAEASLEENKTIFMVGHGPTISLLLSRLTGKMAPHCIATATGLVVQFSTCVEFGEGVFMQQVNHEVQK